MKLIIRNVLLFLAKGSGLLDRKPLLVWHPVVWLFVSAVITSAILIGIKNMAIDVARVIKNEKWRIAP